MQRKLQFMELVFKSWSEARIHGKANSLKLASIIEGGVTNHRDGRSKKATEQSVVFFFKQQDVLVLA